MSLHRLLLRLCTAAATHVHVIRIKSPPQCDDTFCPVVRLTKVLKHIHRYTYIHTCTNTHILTHIHTHTHTLIHSYTHTLTLTPFRHTLIPSYPHTLTPSYTHTRTLIHSHNAQCTDSPISFSCFCGAPVDGPRAHASRLSPFLLSRC